MSVFDQIKRWEQGGVRLSYGVAGRARAPVLLLLHAIRNTKWLFAGIVPELAKQYRVMAVDLRGHGASAAEGPFTFEQVTEDLVQWLEAEDIRVQGLVAASFSAVPAQMLASRLPERIQRLVLLDGGFYRLDQVPGFDLEKTVDRLTNYRFGSVEEAERLFAARYGGPQMPAGWMAKELRRLEDGSFGYLLSADAFRGYFQSYSDFDSEGLFASVGCPRLLLLADERLLPAEERSFYRVAVEDYQEGSRQRDLHIHMIDGAQHLLMVTHPRETVEQIVTFMQK